MTDIFKRNPIRIPVKLVDGQWEFFYGGEVPVLDGTIGDLVVDKNQVKDKKFLKSLTQQTNHKILDFGTRLLVALTVKLNVLLDDELHKQLIPRDNSTLKIEWGSVGIAPPPDTRYLPVYVDAFSEFQYRPAPNVDGGVWLRVEGLEPKNVISSSIKLPEPIKPNSADSLNHAFTILSEIYEPWRKSHTGNIYQRVFYQERNEKWYPIDVLRKAKEATEEHRLIREQWARITEKLNFNPKSVR